MADEGFLGGYFLAAMPTMEDERFYRSVIYICNHSAAGAMGFVLNQPHSNSFLDLITQLDLADGRQPHFVSSPVFNQALRYGGPVEPGRGFVLHSDDYIGPVTTRIAAGVCLTSTIDILRLISAGSGPRHALIALGFAGWGSGQLDSEIAANGWLVVPASLEMIFEEDMSTLYECVLASIGVDLARFVGDAGHS